MLRLTAAFKATFRNDFHTKWERNVSAIVSMGVLSYCLSDVEYMKNRYIFPLIYYIKWNKL